MPALGAAEAHRYALDIGSVLMRKRFGFVAPYRLLVIHTALILLFMFTLSQRWYLTDIPYDCFYLPFFVASGPGVYLVAHFAQHAFEVLCGPDQVMMAWNLVPGTVCIILGGLQWLGIESLFLGIRDRRRRACQS